MQSMCVAGLYSGVISMGCNLCRCSPCGVHSLCDCGICVGAVTVGVLICGSATSVCVQILWECGLCVGTVSIRMQYAGCNHQQKKV